MDSVKNIFGSIGRFLLYLFEFLIIIYVIVITTFLLFRNKYGYTEVGNTTFVPLQIDTAEYIKDGKDAAVSYKSADLKFKNTLDYDVKLEAKVENNKVKIKLIRI